jgi:hypothetical protein
MPVTNRDEITAHFALLKPTEERITPRRKGAKKRALLCAFAPWRDLQNASRFTKHIISTGQAHFSANANPRAFVCPSLG